MSAEIEDYTEILLEHVHDDNAIRLILFDVTVEDGQKMRSIWDIMEIPYNPDLSSSFATMGARFWRNFEGNVTLHSDVRICNEVNFGRARLLSSKLQKVVNALVQAKHSTAI